MWRAAPDADAQHQAEGLLVPGSFDCDCVARMTVVLCKVAAACMSMSAWRLVFDLPAPDCSHADKFWPAFFA